MVENLLKNVLKHLLKNDTKRGNWIVCLIYNQEFSNRIALCNHLSRKHNLKKQKYYDLYIKYENEGICKYNDCNNKTSFLDIENSLQQ